MFTFVNVHKSHDKIHGLVQTNWWVISLKLDEIMCDISIINIYMHEDIGI